ncbi:MAG: TIGR01777 family oxidoreductase [Flavobacteriales bacterium]|nr:TIGR01777 family oxidoreductase [Flavobacteriales bacterium]
MNTIILAGGTGTMGLILQDHFIQQGFRVVVLTRDPARHKRTGVTFLPWDGRTIGDWAAELEGVTAVINLAGRSVDCRYNIRNKALILSSRVDATHALGLATARCMVPPKLWINLSTATIYRHAEDRAMDEATGEIGSGFSIEVAKAWEKAFFSDARAGVRQVAVRCAMVFSPRGGAFPRFTQLTRAGLGGYHGTGTQYVSWVHEADVAAFFQWLIDTPSIEGVINLAAPTPLPETELMKALRDRIKPFVHFNVPGWMLPIGAWFLRTETELVLKSRRVVPTRALQLGYLFHHPTVETALDDLLRKDKAKQQIP